MSLREWVRGVRFCWVLEREISFWEAERDSWMDPSAKTCAGAGRRRQVWSGEGSRAVQLPFRRPLLWLQCSPARLAALPPTCPRQQMRACSLLTSPPADEMLEPAVWIAPALSSSPCTTISRSARPAGDTTVHGQQA
jgi:hypothetical protein